MKLPLRFIALVFLVLSLSTRSSPQTAPSEGAQQFAELGDFRLEDGSVIRRFAERKLFLSDPQMMMLPWNWRVPKLMCVTTRKL